VAFGRIFDNRLHVGSLSHCRACVNGPATKSIDNSNIIINWLHSHPTQTLQGPAKCNNIGENVVASTFIFHRIGREGEEPG
jgi:hypothetical protein